MAKQSPHASSNATSSRETRRSFLKKSAGAAAAGMLIGTSKSWAGANNRIQALVCGVKGQGGTHIKCLSELENVQVAMLCDPDESQLKRRADEMKEKEWGDPKTVWDVREALDDDSLDVVSIATPNHWHSLIAIWACQKGKDVYVEKPLSHNVWEGRQLVKAARKYGRIVQQGTQSRSCPELREGIQLLHDGIIGDVYMGKAMCYKWRNTIGKAQVEPVPKGVHYDLWMGPAPERPFTQNRFHYQWHWQWPYGNGDIGNQGVHEMDVARWGLKVGLPSKVESMGGHFMFDDDQTTPNTMITTMQYPDEGKMLVFEVRHWITNHEGGLGSGASNTVGSLFYGSEGYMVCGANSYEVFLGKERKPGPSAKGSSAHIQLFRNFIDCVISRKTEDLYADVEVGHQTAALCHLANTAYRVGHTIEFDPKREIVTGDREANRLLNDRDRGYRKPYVVPEEV